VNARVLKKYVRPGATVKAGDLLAELSNPQLTASAAEAESAWKGSVNTLNASRADLRAMMINQEAALMQAKFALERAQRRLDAEQSLMPGVIPRVEHDATVLTAAQGREQVDMETRRTAAVRINVQEKLNADQARSDELKKAMERANDQVANLRIVAGIDGIGAACRALDFPVIGGNCSLYNETNGEGILPTPAIGGVGLMKDVHKMATVAFKRAGDVVIVIGETRGHLGQSIYLREIEGREEGAAPSVDLGVEKKNGDFVRGLIEAGRVDTVHDVSDGGLLVAIAEMAMPKGIGASIGLAGMPDAIPFWFGEDQARYVIAAPFAQAEKIVEEARAAYIPVAELGKTGGDAITLDDKDSIKVAALKQGFEGWFPNFMAGEEIPVTN